MINRSVPAGVHAPPKASAMVEALRGLGYTPATAIADIIDNSISAGADRIDVDFVWAGPLSSICIRDNGRGMDREQLIGAMRLGDRNPLDARGHNDLGRFGLGLKTASFSQCRRLTVASSRGGPLQCMRWDLNVLATAQGDGWLLLEGPDPRSTIDLTALGSGKSGTVVAWEDLDRIVTQGFDEQDFLDLIDDVEEHLEMVFHRFLEGPNPAFTLTINGRSLRPWDPFLAGHTATWTSPEAKLAAASGTVKVQCHVLPHRDRLKPEVHEQAGGPEGWAAQQGFYVYRNLRLLVAGSWLGLGQGRAWTKDEAHRLARIRIDIPNTADADWKIDIRKSTARPPVTLRDRLTRLAEDTRERARRVFAHRGAMSSGTTAAQVTSAWRAEHFKGGMRYRLETTHPALQGVLEEAGDLAPAVRAMLRVIEETIPVQRIWLDTSEAKETPSTGFSAAPAEAVREVLQVVYRSLLKKGMTREQARTRLHSTEPFNLHRQLVDEFIDQLPED